MNKLVFAAFFVIISVVGADEQRGVFYLIKVKPRTEHHVEVIVRPLSNYGEHPPIFLEPVTPGKTADVLMDETTYRTFKYVLMVSGIAFEIKGPTLVDAITVRQIVETSDKMRCDCKSQNRGCVVSMGPSQPGYACFCDPYAGFRFCKGIVVKCSSNQHCPAYCTTMQCCLNGGGDCGGYLG